MQSLTKKIIKNIQQGTFWTKAPKALKNRIIKEITASNLIYFFDKGRVLTKNYRKELKQLIQTMLNQAIIISILVFLLQKKALYIL